MSNYLTVKLGVFFITSAQNLQLTAQKVEEKTYFELKIRNKSLHNYTEMVYVLILRLKIIDRYLYFKPVSESVQTK